VQAPFVILLCLAPVLVKQVLIAVESEERTLAGYGWVWLLWLNFVFVGTSVTNTYAMTILIGVQARASLSVLLFRKSLRLRPDDRRGTSVVTLLSADAMRVWEMIQVGHMLIKSPIICVLITAELLHEIGRAAVVGVVLLLFSSWKLARVARRLGATRREMSKHTDRRLQLTEAVLTGIRVLKMYGWESAMLEQIGQRRDAEVDALGNLLQLRAVNHAMAYALPTFVLATTLITYVLLGEELSVTKAFTVLTLFNVIRPLITMMPQVLGAYAEYKVAAQRIVDFLSLPETSDTKSIAVQEAAGPGGNAAELENAMIGWKKKASDDEGGDLASFHMGDTLTVPS